MLLLCACSSLPTGLQPLPTGLQEGRPSSVSDVSVSCVAATSRRSETGCDDAVSQLILMKIPLFSTGRNPGRPFSSDKALGNHSQARECCTLSSLPVPEKAAQVSYKTVELKHHLYKEGSTSVRSLTWDGCFGPALLSPPDMVHGLHPEPLT